MEEEEESLKLLVQRAIVWTVGIYGPEGKKNFCEREASVGSQVPLQHIHVRLMLYTSDSGSDESSVKSNSISNVLL